MKATFASIRSCRPEAVLAALLLSAALAQGPAAVRPIQVWEKPIAPGLVYRMEVDPNVPRTLHAIRLSPQSPALRWNTEVAGTTLNEEGTTNGRLTPTAMAAQSGALVAVNGDFFSYEHGVPIGQLVRNGELVTTSARDRAVFAWGAKGQAIGISSCKASLTLNAGADIELESVNQPIGPNGVALYTPVEGTLQVSRPNYSVVLKLPAGGVGPNSDTVATCVSSSSALTKTVVTRGTAVLVATGAKTARLANLRAGDKVTIHVRADGFDWDEFDNEIGGGPILVRDGKPIVDAVEEGFRQDFLVRHPRTAIGRTADQDVWIVTVDGRQGCSRGATLDEMAAIMIRLGCVDAINLDGGGSTALNISGITIGRPSDGVEREVASGILIFGPRPASPAGVLELNLDPTVAAGATAQARVTLDGKPVSHADILWASRGAAWIDQGGRVHALQPGKAKIFARVFGRPVEGSLVVTGSAVADPKKVPAADRG